MNPSLEVSPLAFKGIALFTPGGDLVYCVDPHKQKHWHVHLCGMLQSLLDLAEPPHFLVPCYTATIDRSIDPQTKQLHDVAEASPLVLRYQPLLNAIFKTQGLVWRSLPLDPQIYDPMVLATYRSQFPQLWENHDLLVRYEQPRHSTALPNPANLSTPAFVTPPKAQGYVFRLFVSGNSMATERTLKKLHQLLEQMLTQPYTLKVIDVTQHPEQAEQDHVTATPTLVRVHPLPIHRIVGNFDNVEQLLGVLSASEE